ncbi:MAG: M1 family peptidase [Chitinophagaceae bacterium]|nr:MAG: M1 family peptidase [Chitinophagaceae bacterium]
MNKKIIICLSLFFYFSQLTSLAQFTQQDSLRGSLNAERDWWDVTCYNIGLHPDFTTKTIEGKNEIQFLVVKPGKKMQIDLQAPMVINRVFWKNNVTLPFIRNGNVYYIEFPEMLKINSLEKITIAFEGNPTIAKNPPWDGGWIFTKDKLGRPWMSVACQGLGASVWYPCKDHQSDEPDSAFINITIPDTLVAVANGRFIGKKSYASGETTYKWKVVNPINNYNIIPSIGKYTTWHENFDGEKGNLDCDYWVLDYNLEKAKQQFTQASMTLKAFEHWFGPYPFYEDGFKLVESPHLGMEHQSAVAYGNKYLNGYLGRDLSGTGWGLKWDFIIVHESGHEWFGNNITSKDIADMWLHEGFTNYSETLFTDYHFGKKAGNEYCIGTRRGIRNETTIIGNYGVNNEGSGDMYSKGGSLLHLIRQLVGDDEKFRQILRGLNKTFYHQTVTTQTVENYISKNSGISLSKIFDQYLRTTNIPILEYKIQAGMLSYRWTNCVKDFDLPLKLESSETWIHPTQQWQEQPLTTDVEVLQIDNNFYITAKKVAS